MNLRTFDESETTLKHFINIPVEGLMIAAGVVTEVWPSKRVCPLLNTLQILYGVPLGELPFRRAQSPRS